MKILLVAINAKYIHSNLAVYCLKSYAAKRGIEVELTEYTINHRRDDILMDIYQRKPDVVAFSCYIWNLEFVQDIAADLYKVLPDLEIWGGGPEVSYDAEKFLAKHPEFRGIMKGEGERTFCELAGLYQIYGKEAVNKLDECHGIVWRDPKGEISQGLPQAPISLDEVPFIYEEYENMMPFENRILYYETSRGCPFSCSYCLSSIAVNVPLVPNLTAKENVELALQICKEPLDAVQVLKEVGLGNRLDNFPAQLSGGEQQRVSIARALAKNPKLLLCDEPTGALDYQTGKAILKLLQDTCRQKKMTVIVITHNSALTPMADRVIKIKNGKVSKMYLNENPEPIENIEW